MGAVLALSIARWIGFDTPIFALIAAVIVTDRNPAETRRLAIRRVISTAIGALCGIGLAQFLGSSAWEAGMAIFVSIVASIAVTKLGDPKLAAYLSALIVINYANDPLHYALDRFLETALGIVVAWVISLVPRLIELEEEEAKEKSAG
ncbi:MAG: hypothetical protein OJF62_001992 [Pseudolabrys sp.]|nr:hypothetical protein [Pseudolabrys sp.]